MNRNLLLPTIDVAFKLDAPVRQRESAPREPKTRGIQTPHLVRLMALAIKCSGMIERGEVLDYADLARIAYVTPARISQIMNLVNLAPDIQEQILFLPPTLEGRAPITETSVRKIACEPFWNRQRAQWQKVRRKVQS